MQSVTDSKNESIDSQIEQNSQTPLTTPNNEQRGRRFNAKFFFIIGTSLLICGIIILMIYLVEIRRSKTGEIDDLIIPQPLVENAEFATEILINGLKVTVVKANEDLDQAYISLSVHVGSHQDPKDFSGLTHLLEHLLFVGSENYPDPETLNEIVNKYGGDSNGETDDNVTSYFFRLDGRGLKELLPVMADGIMYPRLTHHSIEKEINNVNSEIDMNMTFDRNQGVYKLLKSIGNPKSSVFWDGFGNIDADSWDVQKVQKKLKNIHRKYYHPQNMSVVIISEKPTDIVLNLAKKHLSFSQPKADEETEGIQPEITAFNTTKQIEIPAFLPNTQGRVFYLEGESAMSKLSIAFEVLSNDTIKQFSGVQFFDFLMTYKEEGFFEDLIIKRKWVAFSSSEVMFQNTDKLIFVVSFELTKRGQENVDKVINAFYQFLKHVRALDTREQNYKEMLEYSKFSYLFKEYEGTPFEEIEDDYFERVMKMSSNTVMYGSKNALLGKSVWGEWKDNEFSKLMNQLELRKAVFVIEIPDYRKKSELKNVVWSEFMIEKSNENNQNQKNRKLNMNLEQTPNDFINSEDSNENQNSKIIIDSEKKMKKLKLLQNNFGISDSMKNKINKKISDIASMSQEISKRKMKIKTSNRKTHKKRELEVEGKDADEGEELLIKMFRNPKEHIELEYKSDFDGGRAFSSKAISKKDWQAIEDYIDKVDKDSFFPIKTTFETQKVMKFDMISECRVPEAIRFEGNEIDALSKFLKTNTGTNSELSDKQIEQLKEETENALSQTSGLEEETNNKVNVKRIIDILFSPETEGYQERRLQVIKSFLALKICMVEEFEKDDEEPRPLRIVSERSIGVFFRMFRKPLTPRISVRMTVTLNEIIESMSSGDAMTKQKLSLEMQALAGYLEMYVNRFFGEFMLRGHSVSFNFDGVGLLINLSGPSSEFKEFLTQLFFGLSPLEVEEENPESQIQLTKKELEVEIRDQNNFSASELAEFILKRSFDQTAVNARDSESSNEYIEFVNSLSKETIAKWMKLIRLDGILRVLIIGNLRKDQALVITDKIKHFFRNIEFIRGIKDGVKVQNSDHSKDNPKQIDRALNEDKMENPNEEKSQSDIQSEGEDLEFQNVGDRLGDKENLILQNSTLNFGNRSKHYMIREGIDGNKAKNSVYLTYFHLYNPNPRRRVMLEMVSRWLDTAVFAELRERLNLGYVAQSWVQEFRRHPGIAVMIQGENFRPSEIEASVEETIRSNNHFFYFNIFLSIYIISRE